MSRVTYWGMNTMFVNQSALCTHCGCFSALCLLLCGHLFLPGCPFALLLFLPPPGSSLRIVRPR